MRNTSWRNKQKRREILVKRKENLDSNGFRHRQQSIRRGDGYLTHAWRMRKRRESKEKEWEERKRKKPTPNYTGIIFSILKGNLPNFWEKKAFFLRIVFGGEKLFFCFFGDFFFTIWPSFYLFLGSYCCRHFFFFLAIRRKLSPV